MAKIANDITELIGNTPLVRLNHLDCGGATVLLKLESFNPMSSVKDRIGFALICDAEKRGLLKSGGVIIEPTSGNTGIGLAMTAAVRGYKLILTMPETMSIERRKLLAALGAEIVLTPGAKGMKGAVEKAEELHQATPNSIIPGQFDNPANPAYHKAHTAQEIWDDTDGKVDVFVAGIGTGGTLSGVGAGLKKHNPAIEIIGVEPASSPLISEGRAGGHKIQGIGANFVPGNFNSNVVDRIIAVADQDAGDAARTLGKKEGILVGISSGAALFAALTLAKDPGYAGKTIVALMPDSGERYLSTWLFEEA